jgi:DnaJ-domain-containing protein 1
MLKQIAQWFAPVERSDLLVFAHAVADASGGTNEREEEFLDRIAREWRLSNWAGSQWSGDAAPAAKPQAKVEVETQTGLGTSREEQLAALEIEPGTPVTADLVRRQYHLLSERFAPEKFAAAGAEFVSMAESKRAAVRAAAAALMQESGEPLEVAAPEKPTDLRHNPDLDAMFGA